MPPAPGGPALRIRPFRPLFVLAVLVLAACGGESGPSRAIDPAALRALGVAENEAELDAALAGMQDAPIDPPPRVGVDYHPEFPPDLPFDPAEWLTNEPSPGVAMPDAKKGGILRLAWLSWPPTLRTEGPNARLSTLSDMQDLVYETLLDWDWEKSDFVPRLATHWQILPDRKTFRFRLDPAARWSDGRSVTADDVVATFEHLRNPDRKDPSADQWRGRIRSARALDRLTVEIAANEPEWRSMMNFGLTWIYPAAYIRMDGETYLDEWNWKLPPGSGPYELRTDDIHKGRSIGLRRRLDWWAATKPGNRGMFNFDEIVWEVVRDEELMYQRMLADELDVYVVNKAQRWVDELDREEKVRQGWIQKRKVYTLNPEGVSGYCFNMRVPPFNSRNVRLAFAHLFNREELFAKFFYYQYEYTDSYWPAQPWSRPGAERVRYDPKRARELLAADGWVRRDRQGFLVKEGGERFPELLLEFDDPGWERILAVTKTDLMDEAGIQLTLKYIDSTALLKKVWEHRYTVTWWGWTGESFPEPEFSYHSKYANVPQSNNLNGFADPEADRIMEAYKVEFDAKKRREMLQRLDRILFDAHPYALGWYAPYFRVIYWDRFGHPPEYASRYGRDVMNIISYWWFDPERDRATRENREAGRGNHPSMPLNQSDETELRYWMTHERPKPRGDGR